MADVRLTAVNPEDSQVYPVACNDKGELLLDSGGATGDLDVTGNLTVAGSGSFAGVVTCQTPEGRVSELNVGGDAHTTSEGNLHLYDPTSNVNQRIFSIYSDVGGVGQGKLHLLADGSGSFAGDLQSGGDAINGAENGVSIRKVGMVQAARSSASEVWIGYTSGSSTPTSKIYANGSANFGGDVQFGNDPNNGAADGLKLSSAGVYNVSRTADSNIFVGFQTGNATPKIRMTADGSANFAGNVSAPNINFKLAPATVAAMPAPLIDEGFAANNEVDLLSVLIEMKAQIRDLNAFMQRSTQDNPET